MANLINRRALIPLLVIFITSVQIVYAETVHETIKTKQGELKSIEINGKGLLILNNKIIYKSTNERYVAIENYFEKLNVLLINDGPRGSECAGHYRFITLKEDNSVSISKEIGNCAEAKVIEQNNKILVKFPAWEYPGETWAYENGKLSKIGQEYAVTPGFWQSSMDAKSDYISMGVRDKHGDAHEGTSYEAWFIVTGPDGSIYKAKKTVYGDKFGEVRFPQDFNVGLGELKSGIYTWKCIVEGGEVIEERFQYVFPEKPGGFKALDD